MQKNRKFALVLVYEGKRVYSDGIFRLSVWSLINDEFPVLL